ncbi:MAG TPA: right-handed parallel beta-helix repeat-containing protein [Bacteroidales bacterium]|nr:right-handed parallel beta-helix repeat-containing protein [Bacteroidales bacterium]HOG56588.1 right-handed parallel beta-helix repeat-containing protein [Bacteroidales bacterium]
MMRKTLIILFATFSISSSATDYYVKLTGNDSNTGLSDSQAWRTITKVNAAWAAGTFAPGDNIYFNRGDTFYGTLIVSESGTSGNVITIGAYGSGQNPILSGFQIADSWSDPESDGIYVHSLSPESKPNILLLDGVNTPLGRFPNHAYLSITTAGLSYLTDAELPSSPNFSGGEVVIRTAYWVMEKRTITSHSGTTLNYSGTIYAPAAGYGYFIQNHYNCLTLYGEWSYDGNLYLNFAGEDPGDHEVKVSVRNEVVKINGCNYITIQDLTIEGANSRNIYLADAKYITIDNCKVRFSGGNGIYLNSACDYTTVRSSEISESNNVGIYSGGAPHLTITGNYINKSGYYPGMGGSGDQDYSGIISRGSHGSITYNNIYNCGYDGIAFGGQGTDISYNVINGFCTVKDDGGGLYTYRDYNTGKTASYNIILNAIGADDAIGRGNDRANGIYNDGSYNTTYSNNTIAHCHGGGLYLNSCKYSTAAYNTLYDNLHQLLIHSEVPNSTVDGRAAGHIINNNILFSRSYDNDWLQSCLRVNFINQDAHDYGTQDYNYFVRPIYNDDYVDVWPRAWQWNPSTRLKYNLSEWRSYLGEDTHSQTTPVAVTSVDHIHFIYNDSTGVKTYIVSPAMVDGTGKTYSGTISLSPYRSLVLIGSGSVTESELLVPILTTTAVTEIEIATARSGGKILTDNGYLITAKGVCWNTTGMPTIFDSKTNDGTGLGTFISNLTELNASTTYYVRAYATNRQGTGYGEELSFVTGNAFYNKFLKHNGKLLMHNGKLLIR